MKGTSTGAGIGILAVIVIWAILGFTGFWTAIGGSWSVIGGFILGYGGTTLGMVIGSAFDD